MRADVNAPLLSAQDAVAHRDDLAFVEVESWRLPARQDLAAGAIPGAHPAHVGVDFAGAPTAHSGRLPLPDPAGVRATAAGWTGPERRRIVLYTRRAEDLTSATRAWFVLRLAGIDRVSILHGGLPEWVRTGGQVTATRTRPTPQPATPQPASLTESNVSDPAGAPPVRVIHTPDIAEFARYATLLDARSASAYHGVVGQPLTGHVPGAIHAPAHELIDERGMLRPPVHLRRWLLERRALGNHDVAAYCGSGVSSSALVFVGALLGQPISLYVDSWSGWSKSASATVEQGVPTRRPAGSVIDCSDGDDLYASRG